MENDKFFSEENNKIENKILQINYLLLVLLGIVIFFIGGIIRAITVYDYNWSESYQDNIRATSLIIQNIGLLISCIGFMIGAWKPNMDIKIRSSMVVASGSCFVAGAIINMILFM